MSIFTTFCHRLYFKKQVLASSGLRFLRKFCNGALNDLESSEKPRPNVATDINGIHSYSKEDSLKVVYFVNTADEVDFSEVKHISLKLASRIVSYREANGPFQRLRDLMVVPGIGQLTLHRICRGVLKPALRVDNVRKISKTAGVEQTGIAPSKIESLKDIVAVDIGLRHLGWVYMTRNREVWQWRVKDIVGISPGRWDPPAYHKVITETLAEMPKPDLYVIEHQSYTNTNKNTFQTLLYQRALQSMLYATLNANRDDIGTPRVVSMPQTQIGRHFALQVRGTRMSGQDVVTKLIREEMERYGGDDSDLSARLSRDNADMFGSATKHEKEHLTNCLLLAIAFYDLIVDKSGKS